MAEKNEPVLEFLATRRSYPPKLMAAPGPNRDELHELLTMAARVPDHGKLEPWRFLVLERDALDRLKPVIKQEVLASGLDSNAAEKAASALNSPVVVAVISSPQQSPKIPEWEQYLSAGAVCLGLVNAALASGWGASWITGFAANNRGFARAHMGLSDNETIAGLIHLGTRDSQPPERIRPDIDAKTSYL